MDKLLNILFLQSCYICHRFGRLLCENCFSNFPKLSTGYCLVCDKPSKNGCTHSICSSDTSPSQLISFFAYDGLVRESILRSKFEKKEFMTIKLFSIYTFEKYRSFLQGLKDFVVVPIPLSKEKMIERGFNQAEFIARVYCKIMSNQLDISGLHRVKNTSPQYGNSRRARFENVKNVFISQVPMGSKVLLIDDITTSGATFLAATKILKQKGVKDVKCLSLSKKLFENTDVIM